MKKFKPPKFYVSTALKDVGSVNEFLGDKETYRIVMEALKKLCVTLSRKQLAPLPKDLCGSLYDPKMLQLRSDEEFVYIYCHDLAETVEECIAVIMHYILLYDVNHYTKCHVQKDVSEHKLDFGTGSVTCNMSKYVEALYNECKGDECSSNVPKMLKMLYPYMVQFAEKLYLDLNSFIQWYLRYKGF